MSRLTGQAEWQHFLMLYARSRMVHIIVTAILVVIAAATLWSYLKAGDIGYDVDRAIIQLNLMSSITVLAAVALTHVASSPWPEMDNASGTTVLRARAGWLIVCVLLVIVVCGVAGIFWEVRGAPAILVRNLVGWLGVTLVAQRFMGENQARLVSIAWAGVALVSGDSWRVHYPPWMWSMQWQSNKLSWVVALVSFVVGLWLLVSSRFSTTTD